MRTTRAHWRTPPGAAGRSAAVGLLLALLLSACGGGGDDTGTDTAAADGPLTREEIIQAAEEEGGTVTAAIQSTWTPEGLAEVEALVQELYGVEVSIEFTAVGSYPERAATLLSELAAGATSSFDLLQSSDGNALQLLDSDALQPGDWEELLPDDAPEGLIGGDGRLLRLYTGFIGMMYDPDVVAPEEAPTALEDLSDPRFERRFMLSEYSSNYVAFSSALGEERVLSALRDAMANGAVADTYANEYNRFTAGEYPMVGISSSYYQGARTEGVPAAWSFLDLAVSSEHSALIPRNAEHPNTAKLVAAALASPEGQVIAEEYLGLGNRHYPDSTEAALEEQAREEGVEIFVWDEEPEAVELLLSEEGDALQDEIAQIMSGVG